MSEDDKPIFPRPTEKSDEERQRLTEETRLRLETQEKSFGSGFSNSSLSICSNCGAENSVDSVFCRTCAVPVSKKINEVADVYGPPPLKIPDRPRTSFNNEPSTVYGPPPMQIQTDYNRPQVMPAYGPPSIGLNNRGKSNWKIFIILGAVLGFFLVVAALIIILSLVAYFSLR